MESKDMQVGPLDVIETVHLVGPTLNISWPEFLWWQNPNPKGSNTEWLGFIYLACPTSEG